MRILVLSLLISLFSSFSTMAFPVTGQVFGQGVEFQESLIQKVQVQRACRRGYRYCSFDAYDRRGLCRQRARRAPPHVRRRILRQCQRQFRSAINRCKKRFCRFYPYERQIRPYFNPEQIRPRRDFYN